MTMKNSKGLDSLLRRRPRFRRAYHRVRAFQTGLRRKDPKYGTPFGAALLSLLVVALLLAVFSGGSLAAPTPPINPVDGTETPGSPFVTRAKDPEPLQPTTTNAVFATPTPGEASDSASTKPTTPSCDPTGGIGVLFGKDCTEGTQGFRDLARLRTPDVLQPQTIRFASRIEALATSLSFTSRTFADLELDPATGTRALILAKNLVCAENLNGYFYFLFDPDASSSGIAPLVLVVDRLFTDEERENSLADGSYSTVEIETALRSALVAILGTEEGKRASDFVVGLYRELFALRLNGTAPSETRRFLALPETTVVFQDTYMTYVEFLPGGNP
jgi:hypothetical protein